MKVTPRLRVLLVAMLAVSAPRIASSQRPTEKALALSGTDSAHVKQFLATLQAAISRDDSVAVSKLFSYPTMGIWDGAASRHLQRSDQLLPIYRSVFSADVRHIILGASLDSLFANWQGVMIADGRLWFQPNKAGDLRIVTINEGPSSRPAKKPHNEQLLLTAHAKVRGWLIPFASRIVVFAPQQNCGR